MAKKTSKHQENYTPNILRTEPFKWINFPLFLALWFLLFWLILCPIIWSKIYVFYSERKVGKWPHEWPYYFWGVAFSVFCIIMAILIIIWKKLLPEDKERRKSLINYNSVFLNPEYGDEREVMCPKCYQFHLKGNQHCPESRNKCCKCGSRKKTFDECCSEKQMEKHILEGPTYDVIIQKQQPVAEDLTKNTKEDININENKYRGNSKKSTPKHSGVYITMHDVNTKNIITKNTEHKLILLSENNKESSKNDKREKSDKRKPINLEPVDVALANRYSSVEFLGEKICLKGNVNEENTKPVEEKSLDTPRTTSVSSMDSMNKQKFKQFLHLTEVDTPSTPKNNESIPEAKTLPKSPLSPREIFFFDLIQSAEKSENSPDSVHDEVLYKYEKKRPISHILMTSDINFDSEKSKKKTNDPKWKMTEIVTKLSNDNQSHVQKETAVKILHTVKKEIVQVENLSQNPVVFEARPFIPSSNQSSFSEQNSTHEGTRESVSEHFISNLENGARSENNHTSNKGDQKPLQMDVNDEVFNK